jgi:hypothetical protein
MTTVATVAEIAVAAVQGIKRERERERALSLIVATAIPATIATVVIDSV